jgi:RimJ/RimL family protein N-acetyltransferase
MPMTEIRTERLFVRPYRADETDLLACLLCDPRVVFWRENRITEREIEEVLLRSVALKPKRMGWFAAFTQNDGQFVGNVILQPLADTDEIEIGYHLRPEAWGSGYATEAASALLDYGFRALGLPRIVAVVLPENERSVRVLERLGLPYIEDRIHADHLHRYYAVSRADYLAAHEAVIDQPER